MPEANTDRRKLSSATMCSMTSISKKAARQFCLFIMINTLSVVSFLHFVVVREDNCHPRGRYTFKRRSGVWQHQDEGLVRTL